MELGTYFFCLGKHVSDPLLLQNIVLLQ